MRLRKKTNLLFIQIIIYLQLAMSNIIRNRTLLLGAGENEIHIACLIILSHSKPAPNKGVLYV